MEALPKKGSRYQKKGMKRARIEDAGPNTRIRTDDDASTWLDWRRGIVPCTPEAFQEMKVFLTDVRPTPNPRRPSTNILRKQCAIVVPSSAAVDAYDFGQKQETFRLTDVSLSMVSTVIEMVNNMMNMKEGDGYDLVQVNFYSDGSVGLGAHQDREPCIDLSHPIVSVTFFESTQETRPFTLYTNDERRLFDLHLGHGDVLIMSGDVQKNLKHGVEKASAKKYGPRINLTLRKTRSTS